MDIRIVQVQNSEIMEYQTAIINHLAELDAESQCQRFFNVRSRNLIVDWFDGLVGNKYLTDVIWVLAYDDSVPETKSLIGVGQVIIDLEKVAELALSINQTYHQKGIGTTLFGQMIRIAELASVQRLEMEFVSGNTRMASLASRFGFVPFREDGAIRCTKILEPSTRRDSE